ncbi:MAG TPA: DNA repair protein RecO [Gammaproteobacteria bacterium]|nr:DNA repair protein RecO [Gammaproteobacteria bacterium]
MTEADSAFILHRRPYRETSLLVELFTRGSGRVGVIARGARKPRKGATPMEPFRPLQATWTGRGDLRTLRTAEPEGTAVIAAGEALYLGFYVNELLLRLCPRFDPYPRVFNAYTATLAALAAGEREAALRRFETGLLRELGLAPEWERCAGCGAAVTAEAACDWEAERGPLCPACAPAPGRVPGRVLLYLARGGEGDAEVRRRARDLMRAVLAPHLGPRPLESRTLLRSARQHRPGGSL